MNELARLAAGIDGAAFDPATLPGVFDALADAMHCEIATYFSLVEGRPDLFGSSAAPSFQEQYQRDGFAALDVVTPSIKRQALDRITLSQEFIAADTHHTHPFFREFLGPWESEWGLGWNCLVGDEPATFTLMRGRPFTPEDASELARVAPGLTSAMVMATRLFAAHSSGLMHGLAATNEPSLLLDDRGCVSFASPAAEAMFDLEFGVRGGQLFSLHAPSSIALRRLVAAARDRFSLDLPQQFPVHRIGRRPIIVTAQRVAGHGLDGLPGARVLATLTDLDRTAGPAQDVLRRAFHLSAREAEVAALMACGSSPEDVADALRLARSTVRQIVKALMTKTETHRQAELVALLARIAPPPKLPD